MQPCCCIIISNLIFGVISMETHLTKVKNATEFVKELEYFHFGEMIFHRNDSENKVVDYCTAAGVLFEYTNFWDKDEENFRTAQNMTALRRRFKKKITMVGGKGKVVEQKNKQEEDSSKK